MLTGKNRYSLLMQSSLENTYRVRRNDGSGTLVRFNIAHRKRVISSRKMPKPVQFSKTVQSHP